MPTEISISIPNFHVHTPIYSYNQNSTQHGHIKEHMLIKIFRKFSIKKKKLQFCYKAKKQTLHILCYHDS